MKPHSRAALSYLYKHRYHTIARNQDSLTCGAKYDSYILVQILGCHVAALEPFCVFLLLFPLLQKYLPICQMEEHSLFKGLS